MSEFTTALTLVAPYYNLGLVMVVLYLFIKLFRTAEENPDVFIAPWVYLFGAVLVFVLEEIVTVLRAIGLLPEVARNLNGPFELVIIILFVYALLLQRQYAEAVFAHPKVESTNPASVPPLPQTKPKKKK